MRRDLSWVLGASVLLSIATLFGSQAPRVVSAIEPRVRDQAQALDAVSMPAQPTTVGLEALPARLPQLLIDAARRDPFVPIAASAPASAAALAATVAVSPAPTPPAPPAPPPISVRFLGSMVNPEGERLLYLARGDAAVQVKVGDRLDEGYMVESLSAEAVGLVYPPLGLHVTVAIPPAPKQ